MKPTLRSAPKLLMGVHMGNLIHRRLPIVPKIVPICAPFATGSQQPIWAYDVQKLYHLGSTGFWYHGYGNTYVLVVPRMLEPLSGLKLEGYLSRE